MNKVPYLDTVLLNAGLGLFANGKTIPLKMELKLHVKVLHQGQQWSD